jgi:molybdopterin-guanine dinucleotide biosynthesis protein A
MPLSISAIILAGGEGKRLRNPVKAKISVGGRPVIDGILEKIDGIFSEIIISSNNPAEFSGYETCSVVTDIYKGAGPLGGIHAAMTFSDSEAFFVLAGDMPFLDRDLILRMTDYFVEKAPVILVPRTGSMSEPLHAIYSRKIRPVIEELISANRNSSVRDLFSPDITEWFDPGTSPAIQRAFTNINTPEDLNAIADPDDLKEFS